MTTADDGYECPIASADSEMKLALQVWNAWKFDAVDLKDCAGWLVEAVMTAESEVRQYEAEQIERNLKRG